MSPINERAIASALEAARRDASSSRHEEFEVATPRTVVVDTWWLSALAASVAFTALLAGALLGFGQDPLPPGAFARVLSGAGVMSGQGLPQVGIEPGDEIPLDAEVATDAVLELETRVGTLILRDGTLIGAEEPIIDRGELLVIAGDTEGAVRFADVRLSGSGTWRVDATERPRVAVYEGSVQHAADDVLVSARKQRSLRVVGSSPLVPIRYSVDDPWDADNLASVIRLDRAAEDVGETLVGSLGTEALSLSRWESLVGDAFATEGMLSRIATDVVAGADPRFGPADDIALHRIVTRAVADARSQSAAAAHTDVVRAREAGATWGLVLADAELDSSVLVAEADRVLSSRVPTTANQLPVGPLNLGPVLAQEAEPTPESSPSTSPSPSESPTSGLDPAVPGDPVPSPSTSPTSPVPEVVPTLGVPAPSDVLPGIGGPSQEDAGADASAVDPSASTDVSGSQLSDALREAGKTAEVQGLSISRSAAVNVQLAAPAPDPGESFGEQQLALGSFAAAPDGRLLPVVAPPPAAPSSQATASANDGAVVQLEDLLEQSQAQSAATSIPLAELASVRSTRDNRLAQALLSVAIGLLAGAISSLVWVATTRPAFAPVALPSRRRRKGQD